LWARPDVLCDLFVWLIAMIDERKISSAVSAVLRGKNFSRVEAADAEQCGYGDLR
jgi:hypothetical protein